MRKGHISTLEVLILTFEIDFIRTDFRLWTAGTFYPYVTKLVLLIFYINILKLSFCCLAFLEETHFSKELINNMGQMIV